MDTTLKYSLAAANVRLFPRADSAQGPPLSMTVIGAMWESDESILIAADCGKIEIFSGPQINSLRSLCHDKLQRHPSAILAWGTAGDDLGRNRFGVYLKQYTPKNWECLEADATAELGTLNRTRREHAHRSGVNAEYRNLASALIVGWLNGVPSILEIDENGQSFLVRREHSLHAIGSGAFNFRLISRAFDVVKLKRKPLEILRLIMELSAETAPYCEKPIHVWRVRPDGIDVA